MTPLRGPLTRRFGAPRPPAGRPPRSLVVVCHPRADSLARGAADRVLAGLARRGDEIRIIDLDDEEFDPRVGDRTGTHRTHLEWADRVVIVHPTWFSGHPARLAGWFEHLWVPPAPTGAERWPNLISIEIVTSHGSPRWVNRLQAQTGRRLLSRVLRKQGHRRCRARCTAIYDLDRQGPTGIATWLDQVERRYASSDW